MTSQFRTIIGATEYCLRQIQSLKSGMTDLGGKKQKTAMAIGGVIITMVSNLLVISQEVIGKSTQSENPNAADDLREIQKRFNEFLEKMLEGN